MNVSATSLEATGAPLGSALGQIDELYFTDTLFRRVARSENCEVPAGCNALVRGWALAPGPPRLPNRVFCTIDQLVAFDIPLGRERVDVGLAMKNPALAAAGFKHVFSLLGLPLGPHTLRLYAADGTNSGYYEVGEQRNFTIVESRRLFSGTSAVNGRMRFSVEQITTASGRNQMKGRTLCTKIGDAIVVRGSVFDRKVKSRVGEVLGLVNGDQYVLAISGMSQSEAANSTEQPCSHGGFVLRIPTRTLAAGAHDLSLIAVARGDDEFEVFPLDPFSLTD